MENEPKADLFLSYAHSDESFMQSFRRPLQGLLYNRVNVNVWCDRDISTGTAWEHELHANLTYARAALFLVSPDFLVSPWCRRELDLVANAHRTESVNRVFWVQIKPCGWRRTPLADFQSWDSNLTQALTELRDDVERDRAILSICTDIAAHLEELATTADPSFELARALLAKQPPDKGLSVMPPLLAQGEHSSVYRGRFGGTTDAVIKVVTNFGMNVADLSERFLGLADLRGKLEHPSFIQIIDHFRADTAHHTYMVLVVEHINAKPLDQVFREKKQFSIDAAARLLCQVAEALAELHGRASDCALDADRKVAYGLLTPKHLYYQENPPRLRLHALGVSSFLWHQFDWQRFCSWVDSSAVLYLPPDVWDGAREPRAFAPRSFDFDQSCKVDQYFLGQIGLTLIQGDHIRVTQQETGLNGPNDAAKKQGFWKNPRKLADGDWVRNHEDFARIVFRMLEEEPSARFESLDEVAQQLRAVEDESRALAKASYRKLAGSVEFFRDFYTEFFTACGESTEMKFPDKEGQREKLRAAMVEVLNFREGNEPTSLTKHLGIHIQKRVTDDECKKFGEVFIRTLRKYVGDEKTVQAWEALLNRALSYLSQHLEEARRLSRQSD